VQSAPAHKLAVSSICSIADFVISCSLDGSLIQWDPGSQAHRRIAESIPDPIRVYPYETEKILFIGTVSGSVALFSIESGSPLSVVTLFNTAVVSFAVHPTAKKFVSLSPQELVLWTINPLQEERRLKLSVDCCTCCSVTPDGFSCAVSTTEGTARIVDLVSFTEVGCIVFDQSELNTIAGRDFGKQFVVTSCDGKIGVFDIRKMVKQKGLKVGKKPLIALAVSEKVGKAAVAGCDNIITLIDFD
jgi:WD40 repeat protein